MGHEQDGVDAVRAALAAGGDVNERDIDGSTPLMHAALECRAEIVSLLLERGADARLRSQSGRPGSFTGNGQTALLVASGCFMARRRAELAPERHMPAGYAAYELAAPLKMARDLIAHGAEVNTADAAGRTPLMMAAMQGWADVVRELIAAHAAVDARDREGRVALDYADEGTAALLKQAGSPAPSGRSGRTACDVERALAKLGYDTPIIDCDAGSMLREAVRKFQKDRSLIPTGELDAATLQALHVH
ncbi:MAG: ankyrin repeat domain-containing protein [Candidatus Solibacter usitatus]|nr:ankyrin repeat domain-containing protein [Candidatus Solibacter usitatus]